MTKLILAAIVVAVVSSLAACASRSATSPAAAAPKITDWGTIVVTNGIPSRHALAGDRVCTVTVTPLTIGAKMVVALPQTNSAGVVYPYSIGQKAQITLGIEETDSAGAVHSHALSSEVLLSQPSLISFEQTNLINLTVRMAQ